MSEDLWHGVADAALANRIRTRAYEIYETTERTQSDAVTDWIQAECEILDQLKGCSTADTAKLQNNN